MLAVIILSSYAQTLAARSTTSVSTSPTVVMPKQATQLFLPLIVNSSPITVQVLCDGQVYDGYTTIPFLFKSISDQDPAIQKVIRNCTFQNSNLPAIVIKNARNVLIEDSTFQNIRTNITGVGVHAINIPCDPGCVADNITIRNNLIQYIGADGVQLGEETNNITNVYIQNNVFVGQDGTGENAVDVKGVVGPIYITGNQVHGFRPCRSPKSNPPGTQDCTGSIGEGIVVHEGGSPLPTSPNNVLLANNYVYDNNYGISISNGASNITVSENRIDSNLTYGILANMVYSILIDKNTLSYNPVQIKVQYSPMSGGSCVVSNNTFVGTGDTLKLEASTCTN